MGELSSTALLNIFLFLLFPFIGAYIAKKSKLSPIIGYICGGLVLGNFFQSQLSLELINSFAFFGIVLLLFTIGLEIRIDHMLRLRRFIVIGGFLQILLSIVCIFLVSLLFRFPFLTSFLIGIALSSSSTTLVAKIIQDRGEENSFVGEITIGILMFQDLAFIPFAIIFTSISAGNLSFGAILKDIVWGIFESSILIMLLFYVGRRVVPPIFHKIAHISVELLNLFIIVFIFFITFLSVVFQVPILVGVFVAGILVSQTLEHHHIFSQVRPLRDILAVVFFVFIGLQIKIPLILGMLPLILLFSFVVVVVKGFILLFIFLGFRFHTRAAFAISLFLFQIDEDAFILSYLAYSNKVITHEHYLFIVTSVAITLLLTPILIQNKDMLYTFIHSSIKKYFPALGHYLRSHIDREGPFIEELALKNHVVICGYGRVGSYIGRALMMADIPFIAIDYNFPTVEKARKNGINIIYGDPTDIDILDYAEVENATLLISAVPERFSQESILLNAKKLNRSIVIITRIHRQGDLQRIKDLGGSVVIHPEFEAALSIIKKVFLAFNIPKETILGKVKRLKIEHGMG